MAELLDWLADKSALENITHVVVEAPLPPSGQTNANTARLQYWLDGVVKLWCMRRSILSFEAHASTVRKAILGRANWPKGTMKDVVMEWSRGAGYDALNHDAADAAMLWQYQSCRLLKVPFPRPLTTIGRAT